MRSVDLRRPHGPAASLPTATDSPAKFPADKVRRQGRMRVRQAAYARPATLYGTGEAGGSAGIVTFHPPSSWRGALRARHRKRIYDVRRHRRQRCAGASCRRPSPTGATCSSKPCRSCATGRQPAHPDVRTHYRRHPSRSPPRSSPTCARVGRPAGRHLPLTGSLSLPTPIRPARP